MEDDPAELVRAAAGGDQQAWERLVERFSGLVWSIARGYGLGQADAADVNQTSWLRLVEHLHRLRDPSRVGAWLASTARHESLRVLRRAGRQIPVGEAADLETHHVDEHQDPSGEAAVLRSERATVLWRAFEKLSARCRMLLRVLMAEPPPSYEEVSAALAMPIGSIGPTRARCLQKLRRDPQLAGISVDTGDS